MIAREALRLVCVTDRRLAPEGDVVAACRAAVAARGATAVVVREPDLPSAEQARIARAVRAALPRDIPVLLSRDPVLAATAGLDGALLGWTSPTAAVARAALGPVRALGRSVHAVGEAAAAADDGYDFVVFGPVRPTPSKAGLVEPQGFDGLRAAAAAARVPVVAIGGLTPDDLPAVLAAGAAGVAAIRAFLSP